MENLLKSLDLNKLNHFFFAAFLFCFALTNLDSFLLKTKTLNLSKSFNCCLLAWLTRVFPKLVSSKFFWTFSLEIILLSLPLLIPLPTLRTWFESLSLAIGNACLLIPSPSIKTHLSLIISTMVASLPSRGP